MQIKAKDSALLLRAIRKGEVVLFLGAGASATSLNAFGTPVMQGSKLAETLAEMGGLEYGNEALPSVVSAVVPSRVSRRKFEDLLAREYTRCKPSEEISYLLSYCWARLYTWNIDDVVANYKSGPQKQKPFNGMVDQVHPSSDISFLQVVSLHGDAWKLSAGYIFSTGEYSDKLLRGHPWYRFAVNDYQEKTPVFIGSKLQEPILSLELDRARPVQGEGMGVAFLVSPDEFTAIQLAELESRGIVVLKTDLSGFVRWIRDNIGKNKWTPEDVLNERGVAGRELVEKARISHSDLSVAQYIKVIYDGESDLNINRIKADEIYSYARRYLEGDPPSWEIVRAQIPVDLTQNSALREQISEAFETDDRLFVVYGQSGSGKTTGLMSSILNLCRRDLGCPLYEIGGDVSSLRQAIGLLARLHEGRKIVVYLGETFIFGDALAEDLLSPEASGMLFVGDARTREWRNHIRRRLQGVAYRSFEYQRFDIEDYDDLSDAIIKYVPAPRFHKMTVEQRRRNFAASRHQLLIALKEATHAKNFRDVIRKEYDSLSGEDSQFLFVVCGLATLARTGLAVGMAKELYDSDKRQLVFSDAVADLSGIVSENRDGRFVARHEIYVRHVIENVADSGLVERAIISLLQGFTKFEVPVIRSVGRQDGILFKFALNHDFLKDVFRKKGDFDAAFRIYSKFEISFQRDGHFWLQYGQYLSSSGREEQALGVLEKSILAYPENEFAAHALADVQLKVAERAKSWDGSVSELVGAAVFTLEELHKNRMNATDQYPIQTLADRHIAVLVRHGRFDEAKACATRYFNEIESFRPEARGEALEKTRLKLIHFVTSGSLYDGDTIKN